MVTYLQCKYDKSNYVDCTIKRGKDRVKKQFISFISILCCLVLLLPLTANAHSGRTDSSGGHNCSDKSIAKGLCTGYHYHNGGSDSSGGSSSDSSSSGNTTPSTPTVAPEPEPEPVIDEKQVQADQHYKTANDLFNNGDYQGTINELEKIYELGKNGSQTDALVQNSLNGIYGLAETAVSQKDYTAAKNHLSYIQNYNRSSEQIKQTANTLLEQINVNEKVGDILSKATIAKNENDYEETLKLIQEAQEVKDSEEIKVLYNETIEALTNDAETAYQKKQYKQAKSFYNLLVSVTSTPELKDQYQTMLQQIQDEQLLQESFGIETTDFEGNSLFNHLMQEENETPYSENVVNKLKSSLVEDAEDVMNFIFNINIKELFKGGLKDAA